MAEISIGESVRDVLQPDNDRMDLRDRADHGVMDIFEDGERRDEETESSVQSMRASNDNPSGMESLACFSVMVVFGLIVIALHFADGSLGLLGCRKLDDVCHEEMAWDKCIQQKSK